MSARTRKHRTESQMDKVLLYIKDGKDAYMIPRSVAREYRVEPIKAEIIDINANDSMDAEEAMRILRRGESKACSLLKGLRYREGLTQVEFAKRIGITQANLSKLECGRRPIGRTIAKRIAKEFDVNYRSFLE